MMNSHPSSSYHSPPSNIYGGGNGYPSPLVHQQQHQQGYPPSSSNSLPYHMVNNHQPPSSPYNSNHHVPSSSPSQQQQQYNSHYNSNNTTDYSRPNHNNLMQNNAYPQQPQQFGNNFIYNIQNQSHNPPPQHHEYNNGMQAMNNHQPLTNSNNSNNGMSNFNQMQNTSPPMNQHTPDSVPENSLSPNPDLKSGNSDFHPIACINCRKMHKQYYLSILITDLSNSDKKLPSCQRCLSKGISCEYKTPRRMRYPNQSKQKHPQEDQPEPKKKKKKTDSKDNLSTPVPSTPQTNSPLDMENVCTPLNTTLINKFPQTLTKKNIVDIYYSMICDHFILIEKPVLEKYILHKNSNEDTDDSELPLKKEMQAFFYAITALVEQRLGMGDNSEKSAKKSRDSLSKLFDEMNNYVVACTYASLGSYEIGSGRAKLSKFYFHNAKFYFESMDESEKLKITEREKALQKLLTSVEIVNADGELGITTMIHDIPKVFEYTTGHQLPQEIVKATQQEVSPSNCLDYLKIVEMIASYLNKYFRGMATKTRGEKEMEMYDRGSNLCQGLLMNGLRVGVLTKAGYGKDLIEESSLRITYASESEFFPFLPVIVIPHVALASRIHLQIVKKIENGTRQNFQKGLTINNAMGPIDYFEILKSDFRALNILSKRFKRVSVCYGSLLDEIRDILKRRAEPQHNNDYSSTNHSNSVGTPVADDSLLHPLSLDSSSLPPLSFLLGSMNDNPPPSSLDGYTSNNNPTSIQQSIFNSIIQSPIKSPSQQELYFADPFFTHEDLQQIFSPHTYGDFEDGEFSFNVK